jgi:predicted dinucleotide-binding enzyme
MMIVELALSMPLRWPQSSPSITTLKRKRIMKVAVLGTGQVAISLAKGFASRGHSIVFGSRDPGGKTALLALASVPGSAAAVHADAAGQAELAVVATVWEGTQNALALAGAANLAGKLVLDATNPVDFSSGKPVLCVGFPNSGGAQVQAWLPGAHVVKAFSTIGHGRFVDPTFAQGSPDMFIAGNDAAAKAQASAIIKSFGWAGVVDAGEISNAYLLESLAVLWMDYGVRNNHWTHGFSVVKA